MKSKCFMFMILVSTIIIIAISGCVQHQSSSSTADFSKCLTEKGVKVYSYGASWCTFCEKQKEDFGEGWQYINYVECALPGMTEPTSATDQADICNQAGIQGYPTWESKDGQRIGGIASFQQLSQLSGCPVPSGPIQPSEGGIIFIGPQQALQGAVNREFSYSFCKPDVEEPGATCGGLKGATTDPTGGKPPYSFEARGILPPGLALNLNGLLAGTPTQTGTYNFQLCAKDLHGGEGCQNLAVVVTKDGGVTTEQPKSEQPSTDTPLDLTVNGACRFIKNVVDDEGKILARYYTVEFTGTAAGPIKTEIHYQAQRTMYEQYGDPDSWKKFEAPSWTPYYSTARRETGDPSITIWKLTLSNGYSTSQTNFFRLLASVEEGGGYPRIEKELRVECP